MPSPATSEVQALARRVRPSHSDNGSRGGAGQFFGSREPSRMPDASERATEHTLLQPCDVHLLTKHSLGPQQFELELRSKAQSPANSQRVIDQNLARGFGLTPPGSDFFRTLAAIALPLRCHCVAIAFLPFPGLAPPKDLYLGEDRTIS